MFIILKVKIPKVLFKSSHKSIYNFKFFIFTYGIKNNLFKKKAKALIKRKI